MKQDTRQLLRQLPKVDVLLQRPALAEWEQNLSRSLIKQAVQDVLAGLRRDILAERRRDVPAEDELDGMVLAYFRRQKSLRLKTVVNATGTILHTNLGRSVLSEEIGRHVGEVAASYSNLEYDLDEGQRGSRYAHLQSLLKELTGAEDVLVVNNNAAAVLLALTSMTQGKEVVISRGELVEIGGLFRIPDVIEASGGTIREVGTTNKTHLSDYSRAVGEGTGAIMKVHTSNYRIIGFSESVPAQELAELAHANGLPLINDLGSGLFVDMRRFGLPYEPTVKEVLKQGCDVVMFSGDKLLGGPQAGIIVGKAEYIEPMKQHQLLRALRVDKMTLAALEATLQLYRDEDMAIRSIPALQMLARTQKECLRRADMLAQMLRTADAALQVQTVPVRDMVGGGSYPEYTLPGYAAAVASEGRTAAELERRLRHAEVPVVARVQQDRLCLSVRTLRDDEFPLICTEIAKAVAEG